MEPTMIVLQTWTLDGMLYELCVDVALVEAVKLYEQGNSMPTIRVTKMSDDVEGLNRPARMPVQP